MESKVSVKKNFVMNIILTMSSFVFPLITFPYVSRVLLPTGTGKVGFATSVVAYFTMIAQLGIPTYGIRACAQVRDNKQELNKTTHEILIINTITMLISYCAFFFTINTFERFTDDKRLYIVISSTMLFQAIGIEWLYKGLERYSYIAIRSLFFKIIALILMFLLVRTESDFVVYGGITVFASSASSILNLIHSHKYISYNYFGKYDIKRHLKPILVFFAMACATTIYVHLDTVMLGFMKSDIEVGYYNAAVKIRTVLLTVVTSLGAVLLPRASYYFKNGLIESFKKISNKAMHFTILLAIPISIYFIIFAEAGILLLSGPAYEKSVLPMMIIMPTVFLAGMSHITGIEILIPQGKEKVVLYSEIFGAITDLMLNMILIPKMGCAGAAIGTTIAEAVVLGYQLFYLKDYITVLFNKKTIVNISAALVLAIIAISWIQFLGLSPFITLLISGLLFFLVYIGTLIILGDNMIKEMINTIIKKVGISR